MKTVYLTGLGLVSEDQSGTRWNDLLARLKGNGTDGDASKITESLISGKNRRVLAADDILGIAAANMAVSDSGVDLSNANLGCVVFNAGKATRRWEWLQPRMHYSKPSGEPDSLEFNKALSNGSAAVDPFVLLTHLDNVLLWWLCKHYKIDGFNLQITQVRDPGYVALQESVDAIAYGECDKVLLGGVQSLGQSALNMTWLSGRLYHENCEEISGGAAFIFLEANPNSTSHVYGELLTSDKRPTSSAESEIEIYDFGSPALQTTLELIDSATRTDTSTYMLASRYENNAPTLEFRKISK